MKTYKKNIIKKKRTLKKWGGSRHDPNELGGDAPDAPDAPDAVAPVAVLTAEQRYARTQQLAARAQQLAARAQQIADQNAERHRLVVANFNAALAQLQQQPAAPPFRQANFADSPAARDARLAARDAWITDRDALLAARDAQYAEIAGRSRAAAAEATAAAAAAAALNAVPAAPDAVAPVAVLTAEQRYARSRDARLAARDARLANRDERLADRDAQYAQIAARSRAAAAPAAAALNAGPRLGDRDAQYAPAARVDPVVSPTGALQGNMYYNPNGLPAPHFRISESQLDPTSQYMNLIELEEQNVLDSLKADTGNFAFNILGSFYVITAHDLVRIMNNPDAIKYECRDIHDFSSSGLNEISRSAMKDVPYLSISFFTQIQGLVSFFDLWHIIFSQQQPKPRAYELVETQRGRMVSTASHNFLFGSGAAGERAVSAAHCQAGQPLTPVYEFRILPIITHSRAVTTLQRVVRGHQSRRRNRRRRSNSPRRGSERSRSSTPRRSASPDDDNLYDIRRDGGGKKWKRSIHI